jgi:hypothetical protein
MFEQRISFQKEEVQFRNFTEILIQEDIER